VGKIIDRLISEGVYTRSDEVDARSELTEHFMERELSALPALSSYSNDILSSVQRRCERAAETYLVGNPDYALSSS